MTTEPTVYLGSPAFQSGKVINRDGTVTLKPEEFWTPVGGGDPEPRPDQAFITDADIDEAAGTVTATAVLTAGGTEIVYRKTVALERVEWLSPDGTARYSTRDRAATHKINSPK